LRAVQSIVIDSFTDSTESATLRTNVGEDCAASMIALHGQEAWDDALAQQANIDENGGPEESRALTDEEFAAAGEAAVANAAPLGSGIGIFALLVGVLIALARGVAPSQSPAPLFLGVFGVLAMLAVDAAFVSPLTTPGTTTLLIAIPLVIIFYSLRDVARRLFANEIIRVVFPPLVLIIAVLGTNFDMRLGQEGTLAENYVAFFVAFGAFLFTMFGIIWSCAVLFLGNVLTPVVRETAKVTSMVFTILIGSQLLNLVLISFGLCVVLPAGRGPQGDHHRSDLSWGDAVHWHSGGWPASACCVPCGRDDRAEPAWRVGYRRTNKKRPANVAGRLRLSL